MLTLFKQTQKRWLGASRAFSFKTDNEDLIDPVFQQKEQARFDALP